MMLPDFSDFGVFGQSLPQPQSRIPDINSKPLESVLIADCGSNTTRVVLVDVVDQAYRFIARGEAPSTLEAPYADVTIGVLNAIASIESSTGRRLLVGGRLITPLQEDGSGVDAFVASSSAAEALRLVAAGIVRQLSAKTCARASHGTYTTVLDTISLDDFGDKFDVNSETSETEYDPTDPEAEFSPFAASGFVADESSDSGTQRKKDGKKNGGIALFGNRRRKYWRERQIAKLRRLDPNVILLSGGDGAVIEPLLRLVDVVVEANRQDMILANATGETHRPPTLVFAGNAEAQDAVIGRIGGQIEFYGVDNIRPGGVRENLYPLQRQLATLYQERLLPTLPGYARLTSISNAPVTTTCNAVGLMTQFLARDVQNNRVLTADLGGANSALFYADNLNYVSLVHGNFGLSFGLSNILAQIEPEAVQRWLPFEITTDEIVHYALNKTIRPTVIPADERELLIEGAFGREALRLLYREITTESTSELDFNRVIGVGGPLVNINVWQAALVLLDGLEPQGSKLTGLLELELDSTMLMSASGTLAALDANAATYLFRYDCLHRLGPCIIPIGEAAVGSHAVTVTLTTRDGRSRKVDVAYGSIAVLSLHTDEQASLEIVPSRNFRIGQAEKGAIVRTEPGQEISGGSIGLIIDARGRPLNLASNPKVRQEQVFKWNRAYTDMRAMTEEEIEPQPQFMPVSSTPSADGSGDPTRDALKLGKSKGKPPKEPKEAKPKLKLSKEKEPKAETKKEEAKPKLKVTKEPKLKEVKIKEPREAKPKPIKEPKVKAKSEPKAQVQPSDDVQQQIEAVRKNLRRK